jgi:hypothetical protein
MIRTLTTLPLLAALLFGATLLPQSASAAHGFTGVYTSEDPVDGSFQVMTIGYSDTPLIVLVDFNASLACGGGIAIVSGRGNLNETGRELTGTFRVRCLGVGVVQTGVPFNFELENENWVEEHAPTNGTDWIRLF